MRTLFPLLIILVIFSCHSPVPENAEGTKSETAYKYDTLEGGYTGNFGGSNIRIILTHVTGKHATGYNLLKGLRRNISGTMEQRGSAFLFQMNEPGNHPFDGKFNFTIDTSTFELTGTWDPLNDKSLLQKTYRLAKIMDTDKENNENYSLVWTDSIGDFTFIKTGKCVYEYYPKVNGKTSEQLIRVTGTWSLKDSTYTVDWEPNTLFPSRESNFVRRNNKSDDGSYSGEVLIGEGRILILDEF